MKFGKNSVMYFIYSMMLYGLFCISPIAYSQLASKTREELLTIEGLRSLCIQEAMNKNVVDVGVQSLCGNKFLLLNASRASDAIALVTQVAQTHAKIILVDDSACTLQNTSHKQELLSHIDDARVNNKVVIVFLYNLHEKSVEDIETQISFLLSRYAYSEQILFVAHTPLVRAYVQVNYQDESRKSLKINNNQLTEELKSLASLGFLGLAIGLWVDVLIKSVKNRNINNKNRVFMYVPNSKKDSENINFKSK